MCQKILFKIDWHSWDSNGAWSRERSGNKKGESLLWFFSLRVSQILILIFAVTVKRKHIHLMRCVWRWCWWWWGWQRDRRLKTLFFFFFLVVLFESLYHLCQYWSFFLLSSTFHHLLNLCRISKQFISCIVNSIWALNDLPCFLRHEWIECTKGKNRYILVSWNFSALFLQFVVRKSANDVNIMQVRGFIFIIHWI